MSATETKQALAPGQRYLLGRAQLPVTVEVSKLPEAEFVLSTMGGWFRWYVLPGGELCTYSGHIRGHNVFGAAGMTLEDLTPAGRDHGATIR